MKKFFGIIIILLALYIINNAFIFTKIINENKGQLFGDARTYMESAEKINEMYIFPLSHMTHWEHPITKPFYKLRDKLYNTGLSKFPKNEGEREIWWYKIRYVEYRELVEDNLVAYETKKEEYIPQFVYSKISRFHDWDNELYNHIQPIAHAKITDKKFAKFKLDMFVQLSRLYVSMNDLLVLEPREFAYQKTRDAVPQINWVSDNEVKKYDKIYQTYINLLDYSKKHEKASYDYFYNDINRRMWGWELTYITSNDILRSKFYNNQLACDDKYLKIYSDIHKTIRDFYSKNKDKLSYGVKIRFSLDSTRFLPIIAYKYRNCENFKNYADYLIKDIQKDSPNYQWENIKIETFQELKKEKRFEELKRVKTALESNK